MLKEFMANYGIEIISSIVIGIIGFVGLSIKSLFKKVSDDKTKQKVARTVVQAVEQLYKDLNGEEKFEKAVESIMDMLSEKGIGITELETQMLIESAVTELKINFSQIKDQINKEDLVKQVADYCMQNYEAKKVEEDTNADN